ncbi:DNA repair protein XRCC1 [Trichogramma pretiosum]|uniref:DNA repair protein XRCC1 n=1 Tax=Trichogramma pretiosum TaxID=7493 RepID=UPI0006C9C7E7|nr:DNA repair protein XRCC1 [Trichogramma pretiosum]
MIIKVSKIISCSSEDPAYPASNLLDNPPKAGWHCAKPTEVIATVILQLAEPSCITGLEIGNYRSCIVVVEASTSEEPDKWVPVVNHQFLSHDEALNNKFRAQVQIFTKRELNPDTVKIKFDRVKVTCMQSANPREVFGLEFISLKTEVVVEIGLDVFGRFKLKEKQDGPGSLKEKYFSAFEKKKNYKEELKNKIAEQGASNFNKKQESRTEPKKRPLLDKLEADNQEQDKKKSDDQDNLFDESLLPDKNQINSSVPRTLFGDVIPSPKQTKKTTNQTDVKTKANLNDSSSKTSHDSPKVLKNKEKEECSKCNTKPDELCTKCNLLRKPKALNQSPKHKKRKISKPKKQFNKLFEDINFALSGYKNPQRDEIRKKALKMGAQYNANPNTSNNKCTHLVSAFPNTPKIQQLKGSCKIVSHKFIEDCYDNKKRIPWRRYAIDSREKNLPESEEEIEGTTSPIRQVSVYDQETEESDADY